MNFSVDDHIISVIMPAYNAERTIKKTINSVIAQTYENWELIIVDDGSNDNTKNEVFSVNDKRIKYIFQMNLGPSAARNRGIEEASGQYVCFLDSDDLLHIDYLKELVDMVEKYNADIAMCDYLKAKDTPKIDLTCKNNSSREEVLFPDDCIIRMFYKDKVMPYPFLKLFRRNIIDGTRFPEGLRLGEDLLFNYEVFRRINKAVISNKILYFHIENPNSITHSLNEDVAQKHFNSLKELRNKSDEKYRKSISSRMFIVAFDFLSQKCNDNTFNIELKDFIKKENKGVLKDNDLSGKVRILAFFSMVSIEFSVFLCRITRRFHSKKAV